MLPILVIGLIFLAGGIFLAHRMSKRDDGQMFEPRDRVIITLALVLLLGAAARTLVGGGAAAGVFMLVIVIPAGVILSYIWLPTAVDALLSGLTGAMTGGNEPVEPKPFYFRALAMRRKGKFSEALVEIDAELVKFPGNLEGMCLKAEIQADDLQNLPAAAGVLQEAITTPGRPAGERLSAQFRLAELLVHRMNDVPAGKALLETILEENPGAGSLPQEDWTARAQEWVTHLEQHPTDWEAREKLATVYADHFQRIPLAIDQIRTLIDQPGQPPKRVAGWLNRIADLELRADSGAEGVGKARAALEEVQTRYPDSPWAEQAVERLAILGRSERAKTPTPTLKIGVYEQNIGLKRGSADIPNPDPDAGTGR
ncbi:MAG: hypothetical protein LW626_06555 [Verrucomicrobium sp.]|nr:hypothetical protein [Verrucomicrobium sp.]